jgi:hypothetical protein
MAEGFGTFLATSLSVLRHEQADIYARLRGELHHRPVSLLVDEESSGVELRGDLLAVQSPARPAIEVVTSGATILELVDGHLELREAVVADALLLRGTPEHLVAFDRALVLYMNGAVRSAQVRSLLGRFRAHVRGKSQLASRSDPDPARLQTTGKATMAPGEPQDDQAPKASEPDDPFPQPDARSTVTVFGAGVTGLTVAHELVERGFRVQVWEPETDPRLPERGAYVGGMARTQWASLPRPEVIDGPSSRVDPDSGPDDEAFWRDRQAKPVQPLRQRFFLRWNDAGDYKVEGEAISGTQRVGTIPNVLSALLADIEARDIEVVYAEGIYSEAEYERLKKHLGEKRASMSVEDAFRHEIEKESGGRLKSEKANDGSTDVYYTIPPKKGEQAGKQIRLVQKTLKLKDARDWLTKGQIGVVHFRAREYQLPGEHGYRFFPAFYAHLFDTLKRIPLVRAEARSPVALAQEENAGVPRPSQFNLEATGPTVPVTVTAGSLSSG